MGQDNPYLENKVGNNVDLEILKLYVQKKPAQKYLTFVSRFFEIIR